MRNLAVHVVYDIKRILGRDFADINIDPIWPFAVLENNSKTYIQVKSFHGTVLKKPETIAADLLQYIKKKIDDYQSHIVTDVVITIPCEISEKQKNSTKIAAETAGFKSIHFIPEPVAAAFAYFDALPFPENENALVCDFGGGTVDISVVKIVENKVKILTYNGDSHLGGRDFDRILFDYFASILENQHHIDLKRCNRKHILNQKCQDLKHDLSVAEESGLYVSDFGLESNEMLKLSRVEFERMTSGLLLRTRHAILETLFPADLRRRDILHVFQVGGGCQMPMIKNLLLDMFPYAEHRCSIHPDEVVAQGAALYAYFLKTRNPDFDLLAETLKKEKTSQEESRKEPKKTLNILLLGETGVEKSTWINSIANYLTYDTLEDALAASSPICLIPCFIHYKGNNMILEPSHGKIDENELFNQEEPCTQEPKIYEIETAKHILNIIDTPGIGAIPSPERDKEIIQKISNVVRQYKDFHAICFLFKVSELGMYPSFRYCISEFWLLFHKAALDNIFFFFTHTSTRFYKYVPALRVVQTHIAFDLRKDRGLRFLLNEEDAFCFDNEGFRYIAAHFNGMDFSDDFISERWEESAAEFNRFLEVVASKNPHPVKYMILIDEARKIISHLVETLSIINEMIDSNKKNIVDRLKNLFNNDDQLLDKNCEETIKAEQQILNDVLHRVGSFLQKNAILLYNDEFEPYIKLFMRKEQAFSLGNPKKLLKTYHQEKSMLQESLKNSTFEEKNELTIEEISDMKALLFKLKQCGKTLENLFKATENGLNKKIVTVCYNPETLSS